MVVEIPKGWGGYFSGQKNGNSGEEGGPYMKFPPWWGYGYFLELHNNNKVIIIKGRGGWEKTLKHSKN